MDARCTFAPERSKSRKTNAEGLREFVETVPSLLIETGVVLKIGMLADVTPDGGTLKRYQIERATYDSGICGSEWILELKAIDTP